MMQRIARLRLRTKLINLKSNNSKMPPRSNSDEERRAAMTDAAERVGSRTGTEDLIALTDRALAR